MHYKPLPVYPQEEDILSLITVLMENTKGEDAKGGEDFWLKAEALCIRRCSPTSGTRPPKKN